jgi:hypothetical protein
MVYGVCADVRGVAAASEILGLEIVALLWNFTAGIIASEEIGIY